MSARNRLWVSGRLGRIVEVGRGHGPVVFEGTTTAETERGLNTDNRIAGWRGVCPLSLHSVDGEGWDRASIDRPKSSVPLPLRQTKHGGS
eukprot:scaffold3028_cov174-Amphora_coffeaeformis.AAC.17